MIQRLIQYVNINDIKLRNIVMREILVQAWQQRKKIGVWIILCAIGCSVLGFCLAMYNTRIDKGAEGKIHSEQIALLENQIAQYTESMDEAKARLVESEKFKTKSMIMQLDPYKVPECEMVFEVKTKVNPHLLVNKYVAYIKSTAFREEITKLYQDISSEDLESAVKVFSYGNLFNVTVMHKDMDTVVPLAECIKANILKTEWADEAQTVLVKQGSGYAVEYDILNKQNNIRNIVQNDKLNIANMEKAVAFQEREKFEFIKRNEPTSVIHKSPIKAALKFLLFGLALGVSVPIFWYIVKYMFNDKIKSETELEAAGITVLNSFADGNFRYDMSETSLELELLSRRYSAQKVTVCDMSDNMIEFNKFNNSLQIKDVCFEYINTACVDSDKLKALSDFGQVIFIIRPGVDLYCKIEELLRYCKTLGINIWGALVVY
ncbi:hypothetical protein FYJ84_00955 [Veillonellaceae bacterium WCA-693-APC-5D-A]|uniref:Uncharacterized protein n=1 Tax=Anaerovibrio slackiae TaxID=2652309 RepID=A0A6I2U7T6_9FIRM|nr:hypothetical protein [Anaerovibrio slackiae]MSU07568.1 hypothetical protein [Anaerovibrio slackiae]